MESNFWDHLFSWQGKDKRVGGLGGPRAIGATIVFVLLIVVTILFITAFHTRGVGAESVNDSLKGKDIRRVLTGPSSISSRGVAGTF